MATGTFKIPASELEKNSYVVIFNRPCKVVQKTASGNEYEVEAVDIFTNAEVQTTINAEDEVEIPNVRRDEYSLVNIDDGMLNVMSQDETPKDDIPQPNGDLGAQIKTDFEEGKDLLVTVLSAMGEQQAISVREKPSSS